MIIQNIYENNIFKYNYALNALETNKLFFLFTTE